MRKNNICDKEKCVLCGKNLEIDKASGIDGRSFYVDGGGQLCEECFNKTYPQEKSVVVKRNY